MTILIQGCNVLPVLCNCSHQAVYVWGYFCILEQICSLLKLDPQEFCCLSSHLHFSTQKQVNWLTNTFFCNYESSAALNFTRKPVEFSCKHILWVSAKTQCLLPWGLNGMLNKRSNICKSDIFQYFEECRPDYISWHSFFFSRLCFCIATFFSFDTITVVEQHEIGEALQLVCAAQLQLRTVMQIKTLHH